MIWIVLKLNPSPSAKSLHNGAEMPIAICNGGMNQDDAR